MKPKGKKTSASYAAYLTALGKVAASSKSESTRQVRVVVATCTGCRKLGRRLGRELALAVICDDPTEMLHSVSSNRHGGGLMQQAASGFSVEAGWTDWAPIVLSMEMSGGRPLPDGVSIERGSLLVRLPSQLAVADFGLRFTLLMDRQRFDEALTHPSAVKDRFMRDLPLGVTPRFSAPIPTSPLTWRRVRNLYAFDPWQDIPALATRAAAAAIESTPSHAGGL